MKSPIKRKVLIPLVAVAALGGGAAAVAATSSSSSTSPRQAYIDSVAKHLGVSPGTLTAAMQAAAVERIEAAVASGRLTKAEGQALEQRIKEGRGPLLGAGFGRAGRGEGSGAIMAAAASYLGLGRAVLHEDRRAGKSLAQIASSTPGKSVDGLKAALLAAAKQRLSAAESSGRISSQEAQARASRLPALIEALVQRTGTGPGWHMGLGPGHPGQGGPGA